MDCYHLPPDAVIYQVTLFEETDYYLMQGIVAEEDQKSLETFKTMAMTFKRKNPSVRRTKE